MFFVSVITAEQDTELQLTAKNILHIMHHEMYTHLPCQYVTVSHPDPKHICSDDIYDQKVRIIVIFIKSLKIN